MARKTELCVQCGTTMDEETRVLVSHTFLDNTFGIPVCLRCSFVPTCPSNLFGTHNIGKTRLLCLACGYIPLGSF